MLLTKWTHACVRLEKSGQILVLDPGTYSEPEALQGAAGVLVTHEHADHVDPELLVAAQTGNPSLAVYTNADVVVQLAEQGVRAEALAPGDTVTVAGFDVRVVGGAHAQIYDGRPDCANIGFVVEGVYHPGDSFFVPDGDINIDTDTDTDIDTVLVPASGPWFSVAQGIDFLRAVGARRAHPIHDAMLSALGRTNVDRWLAEEGGSAYSRVELGESVEL